MNFLIALTGSGQNLIIHLCVCVCRENACVYIKIKNIKFMHITHTNIIITFEYDISITH